MNGCLRPGGFPEIGCHPPSQKPGLHMSISWAECLPGDTTWKVRISLSYPSSHSGGTCFPLQTAPRQQRVHGSHFCKIPKSRRTKRARELLTWGGFRVSVVGFIAILQCLFRPSSEVRKEMDGAHHCTGRETPSVPGRQLSDGENQIFHLHFTLASNS